MFCKQLPDGSVQEVSTREGLVTVVLTAQYYSSIFNPKLVEPKDTEPRNTEAQVYTWNLSATARERQ